MHPRLSTLLGAAAFALSPVLLHAQVIRGRLVTADSTRGLSGVIVTLSDAGKGAARTLSGSDGGFILRANGAGSYHVRALRIGFMPEDFGPFNVGASDTLRVILAVRDRPVSLQAVTVSDRTRCEQPGEGGTATLALWEEARKALLTTVLTRTALVPTVTIANYERVTDPTSQRQRSLRVREQKGASQRPYVSPLPPEEYAARGYVEFADDGSRVYRAPDADVLLSDSFSSTHCFSAVAGTTPGLVGLAFRPSDDRAERTDVEGTLWIDRASNALRTLEFHYTGPRMTAGTAGGNIAFTGISAGAWFITRWELSAPRLVTIKAYRNGGALDGRGIAGPRSSERDSIADMWRIGGRVLTVVFPDGQQWSNPIGRVTGQVVSPRGNAPVASAHVALAGTSYSAVTDASGNFTIPRVLPGVYSVEARSQVLATTGFDEPSAAEVTVSDTGASNVIIQMASAARVISKVCGIPDSLGAIAGTVTDEGYDPAKNATVKARWFGGFSTHGGASLTAQELFVTTTTNAEGMFRICGVPLDQAVRVSATQPGMRSPTVTVNVPSTEHVFNSQLHFGRIVPGADAKASLEGTVRDAGGKSLAGVNVEVSGASAVRSDSVGFYRVAGLDAGSYLLRVGRPGSQPQLERASIDTGEHAILDITVSAAQALAAVSTTARGTDTHGIEHRRATGHGFFMSAEEIAKRSATSTEQLLRLIPGIRFESRPSGRAIVADRGAQSIFNPPCDGVAVIIDGSEVAQPFDVNQIAPASLLAIEFYSGGATTPPELRSAHTECGTLALWTK